MMCGKIVVRGGRSAAGADVADQVIGLQTLSITAM